MNPVTLCTAPKSIVNSQVPFLAFGTHLLVVIFDGSKLSAAKHFHALMSVTVFPVTADGLSSTRLSSTLTIR